MRALSEIATRLWQIRATVKEMERRRDQQVGGLSQVESSRLLAFKSALHILAWALEIDLEQLDGAPLLPSEEYPQQVMAHRVEIESITGKGARCLWLVEIPAYHDRLDAGFSTEYQAFFLSDEHARELYDALGEALPVLDAGDGPLASHAVCTLPQLRPAPRRVIHAPQPTPQPTVYLPTRPAPKPRPARRQVARPLPDSEGLGYGDWGA